MRRTLKDIAQFFGKRIKKEQVIVHSSFDSRLVQRGGLFFALQGERVDGHSFLPDVAKKGAVAAIVSESYVGEDYGLTLIPVPDVKKGSPISC